MAKAGAPINISNSYDKNGTLTTTLPRTGVDIGAVPDYWSDFTSMAQQLKNMGVGSNPGYGAQRQSAALAPQQMVSAPPAARSERIQAPPPATEHKPIYGTMVGTGPQSIMGYSPWAPGQGYSPLNAPVALGWT